MISIAHTAGRFGCLPLAALFVLTGCQSGLLPNLATKDVSKLRHERYEQLSREYEQRRDAALLQSAQARFEHGDLDGSRRDLDQLLTRSPDHREGRLLSVEVYLCRDDLAQAEHEIDEVLQRWPEDAETQQAKTAIRELRGMENGSGEAVLPASYPAEPDCRKEGQADARRAQLLQSDPTLRSALAPQSVSARRNSPALQDSTDLALKKLPPVSAPGAPLEQALEALQRGQPDEAAQLLRPAVAADPANPALQRTLAVALYRSGDPAEAQIVLQQALSLDNRDALSYFLLGCVKESQGLTVAAEECFLRASQLDQRLDGLAAKRKAER